ncbi:MAG: zinc ribbon domain-containing protein [Eubacterium sp.]|nr:zinc ribbon domain-containing protein [Eubacterium sp.]MCM1418561.1 zinc ribbon domain-containing protein [Roseburia sp.]
MTIAEKVSYIKGLAEGMKLDDSTNEGKVIHAMLDVLNDIALNIEEIDSDLADVGDVVSDLEDSVYDLEEEVYGEYDDDEDDDPFDDDDLYEITCPNCGNSITTDFEVISEGELDCPNCGERLEFDLKALDEDDDE